MRVLGVDPGSHTMGYSVLDLEGDSSTCRAWGTLEGGPSREIAERLLLLLTGLRDIVTRWRPDQIAIEEPFVSPQRGAKSAITLGQSQAVALLVAAETGMLIRRYAPAKVKRAVANYGAGTKAQVQRSVQILLGLGTEPIPEDASDAIAIALCHIQELKAAERLSIR